jgi:hypothetical protein
MQFSTEDIKRLRECTCLKSNEDIQVEDLMDADFHDPECPVHGDCLKIVSE